MHSPLKALTQNFIVWKMGVQNMATMHRQSPLSFHNFQGRECLEFQACLKEPSSPGIL